MKIDIFVLGYNIASGKSNINVLLSIAMFKTKGNYKCESTSNFIAAILQDGLVANVEHDMLQRFLACGISLFLCEARRISLILYGETSKVGSLGSHPRVDKHCWCRLNAPGG